MVIGGKSERLISRESENKQRQHTSSMSIQISWEQSNKTTRLPTDQLGKLKEASNQSWNLDWSSKMKQFLVSKPSQYQQKAHQKIIQMKKKSFRKIENVILI